MPAAFSYDLATDVGKVRFELGDTAWNAGVKPDGSNLLDAELAMLITREGHVMRAVAAACETLARMWSSAVDMATGPHRESLSQAAEAWRKRGQDMRVVWGYGADAVANAGTAAILSEARSPGEIAASEAEEWG